MKRIEDMDGYSKLIASILSLGIICSGLSGCVSKIDNSNTTNTTISTNIDDSREFFNKLYKNSDGEKKQALENVKKVVFDYGNLMDQDQLLNLISDLDISHKYLSISETGYYEKSNNLIVINDSRKSYNDSTLFHEMIHFLSQTGFQKEVKSGTNKYYIGKGINEGMTQEIVNEYFINDRGIYYREVAYVKALMEILGTNVMLDSYFSNDLDKLLDRMDNYISRRDAEALIVSIDGASLYSSTNKKSFEECSELAWVIISNMYKKVFKEDMEDNHIMMAYKSISCDDNFMDDKKIDRVVVDKDYFIEDSDPEIIYYYDDMFIENGIYTKNKVEKVLKKTY